MEQQFMNEKNTYDSTIINKSEFIGYIGRTESEEDAKDFIHKIKSKHTDATHNCSAYIVGKNGIIQKADDDGEPSGTAGVPILEVLKREGMYNVTVVVTRYFGGIKLGGGGLIRAYSSSASSVVHAGGKVVEVMLTPIDITMDYTYTNKFEHSATDAPFNIENTSYTDKVTYTVHIEEKDIPELEDILNNITKNTHDITIHDPIISERVHQLFSKELSDDID